MTFSRYPEDMNCLILDQVNEEFVVGQVTSPANSSLSHLRLFVYRQARQDNASFTMTITVGGTDYVSEVVDLGDLVIDDGDNYLGKVEVRWIVRPNLSSAAAYDLKITMSNYSPIFTNDVQTDTYFSIIRDYPTEMGYNTTQGARYTTPVSLHLVESV